MPARCLAARSRRAGVIRGSNRVGGGADCCAFAASGQATAPPNSVTNSRRFILFPPTVPHRNYALPARRPPPLVEPGAILRHLRALRRRRTPLARRRLLALL